MIGPPIKAKYSDMINSEKYCEGKLKRYVSYIYEKALKLDVFRAVIKNMRKIKNSMTYLLHNGSAS